MALINCEECQHPLSSDAKICPNCSAPRRIVKPPQGNSSSKLNPRKMATPKKNEEKGMKWALPFVLGAVVMYLIISNFTDNPKVEIPPKSENPEVKYFARVNKINGLYVYVNSQPANQESYTTLQSVHGETVIDIYKTLGIGKEKFGQVLINMINAGNQNLVFSNIIEKLTTKVNEQYPEASGIIIVGKLNTCQVIKFK